MKQKFNSWKR